MQQARRPFPSWYLTLPYGEAQTRFLNGNMDACHWKLFGLLWTWAAPRYTGAAGVRQSRFAAKCGQTALDRRIERARSRIELLKQLEGIAA